MSDPEKIGIIAEPTPNPASFKFTVDRPILPEHSVHFASKSETEGSELPRALFELEDVAGVFVSDDIVTVTKATLGDWRPFAVKIGPIIREAIRSGKPLISEEAVKATQGSTDVEKRILAVLAEIRPNVQMDGGDIVFAGFRDGIVSVSMRGSCAGCPSSTMTLHMGIEQRLKQVVPEVKGLIQI
jgi:Fe-S cluster biogenesis protein NfuA